MSNTIHLCPPDATFHNGLRVDPVSGLDVPTGEAEYLRARGWRDKAVVDAERAAQAAAEAKAKEEEARKTRAEVERVERREAEAKAKAEADRKARVAAEVKKAAKAAAPQGEEG